MDWIGQGSTGTGVWSFLCVAPARVIGQGREVRMFFHLSPQVEHRLTWYSLFSFGFSIPLDAITFLARLGPVFVAALKCDPAWGMNPITMWDLCILFYV